MSMIMRPVGPRSARVYWIRRIIVIAVILFVVLGVKSLLSGGRGAVAAPDPLAPATSEALDPSSDPAPSDSVSPGSPGSASPDAGSSVKPTPTVSTASAAACGVSDISVTTLTDAASYATGSTPRLTLRIKNISSHDCSRGIGADRNELIISMGTTRIWSSDDCSPGGVSQTATLKPGQSYSVTVTWLGRRSDKGCPQNSPAATKGSYRLVGRNGTATADPTSFSLT